MFINLSIGLFSKIIKKNKQPNRILHNTIGLLVSNKLLKYFYSHAPYET